MTKPRCKNCTKSMKTLYHRKGERGIQTVISGWWYCEHCNDMESNVYDTKNRMEFEKEGHNVHKLIDYRDVRVKSNKNNIINDFDSKIE